MSIAEKLTTVAENQQRVYDAGYGTGYETGHAAGYELGEVNGWTDGKDEGYAEGLDIGIKRGVEQGKQESIERYCPVLTESGASVTCNPVENYPLNVVSGITPIQAGSGDPTPSNVRPITAHANVKVTRCGVNLIDLSRFLEANWAVGEDGAYFGKPTDLYAKFGKPKGGFLSGCFKPNTRYTLKSYARHDAVSETTVVTAQAGILYTDGTSSNFQFCQSNEYKEVTVVTSANKTVEMISFTYSGNATSYVKSMTMCEGTVATDEPYQGDVFTAQLGQDAYCGNFDWSTGVLTLTHKMLTLTGNESWNMAGSYGVYNGGSSFFGDSVSGSSLYGYCSHAPTENNMKISWNYVRKANSSYGIEIVGFAEGRWGEDLTEITVAKWKEYTKAQYDAGTPIQVLYQLNEPITVQLTPQEILSLSGTNTVYCDTGDTTVTFKADPIALVGQLEESIISLGGEI